MQTIKAKYDDSVDVFSRPDLDDVGMWAVDSGGERVHIYLTRKQSRRLRKALKRSERRLPESA